jgi:hypothetical protein
MVTDRDHGADAGSEGTGLAGRASGSDASAALDNAGATNVVPFPGNWFGSVDELVPITPARGGGHAPAPQPDGDARRAESSQGRSGPSGPRAVPPSSLEPPASDLDGADYLGADASAFWDGDALPVQDVVVTGAVADAAGPAGRPASEPAPAGLGSTAPAAASARPNRFPLGRLVGGRSALPQAARARLTALALLVPGLIAGGFVLLGPAASPRRSAQLPPDRRAPSTGRSRSPERVITKTVADRVTVTQPTASRSTGRRPRHHVRRHRGAAPKLRSRSAGDSRVAVVSPPNAAAGAGSASATGPVVGTTSAPMSTGGSSRYSSSSSSTSAETTSSHGPSGARQHGCVESPDSGCLP